MNIQCVLVESPVVIPRNVRVGVGVRGFPGRNRLIRTVAGLTPKGLYKVLIITTLDLALTIYCLYPGVASAK